MDTKQYEFGHYRLTHLWDRAKGQDERSHGLLVILFDQYEQTFVAVINREGGGDYQVASLADLDRDWIAPPWVLREYSSLASMARVALTHRYVWQVGIDWGHGETSTVSHHRTLAGARKRYEALIAERADELVYCHAIQLED